MTSSLTIGERRERAERRVNRFVGRFEPSYYELVCHAALPLVLTPELVSYLRNEFLRETPWIAEVDLLLSELCTPVGYELYVMDADVRAYVLEKRSETFNSARMREVANLLISYVRYLSDHRSLLSDQELKTQQWAAMLYLGEAERRTVVSDLVEGFQLAGAGGTPVGDDLPSRAEMARLAQITQTLKEQLVAYPELIEYASLVSDVQMRNILLDKERVEKTYVVAPEQTLRLPSALRAELVAQKRIRSEVGSERTVSVTRSSKSDDLGSGESEPGYFLPDFEPFYFIDSKLIDAEIAETAVPFPPTLLDDDFTIITVQLKPIAAPDQNLETFEFTVATVGQNDTGWIIRRQRRSAYQYVEALAEASRPSFLAGIAKSLGFWGDSTFPGLEMVAIPGGAFLMGSPADESEREQKRESPQHEVTIAPFFMGRYPVTQVQWRAVAAMPQIERELRSDPSRFKGDNRPVERVSWRDAVEFCSRLSAHTGRYYRLPTEAEWEYACRAGTTTPFHFGDMILTEVANFDGSYAYSDGPRGEYRGETTAVDQFGIANAFGLSDMHGNVWEWCQDKWHGNYDGAPIDGSAWLSSGEGDLRVRRGGSWYDNPGDCRSAYRNGDFPDNRYDRIGFRVCCSAPRTP